MGDSPVFCASTAQKSYTGSCNFAPAADKGGGERCRARPVRFVRPVRPVRSVRSVRPVRPVRSESRCPKQRGPPAPPPKKEPSKKRGTPAKKSRFPPKKSRPKKRGTPKKNRFPPKKSLSQHQKKGTSLQKNHRPRKKRAAPILGQPFFPGKADRCYLLL